MPYKKIGSVKCECGELDIFAGIDGDRYKNPWPGDGDPADKVGARVRFRWKMYDAAVSCGPCCGIAAWKQKVRTYHGAGPEYLVGDWEDDKVDPEDEWYSHLMTFAIESWRWQGEKGRPFPLAVQIAGDFEDYPGQFIYGPVKFGLDSYINEFVAELHCVTHNEILAHVKWTLTFVRPLFSSNMTVKLKVSAGCGPAK